MHPRWPAFVSRVYPEKQPAICWWIRIPYARLIHDHSWCVLRASFEFLITLVVALIFSTGVATADFSSPSTSPEKITPAPISSAESSVALERDEHPSIKGTVFGPPAPRLTAKDYPDPLGESRVAVWVLAQQHLYWAAFLLGTLLIVSVLEIIALIRRDEHDAYACDVLAREFLDLVMLGLSVASLLGGTLLFCLLGLYPDLMRYLLSVSRSVFLTYGILVLGFTILAYLYYVTWESFDTGCQKWIHASLGILANVSGTSLAFLGNSWSSFMISPAGIDSHGRFLGNTWRVIHTALWNPLNVHRLAGHLLCAGAVLAAYGAYRCLTAKTTEEKAHFDWIGSVALFALLGALFTMPFGGYWLLREIYAYRQQMGITLLGGLLAWPGILLVSAMSLQFLGINYYLWQRISSVRGGSLHVREAKWVFFLLGLCTVVYISPHTMVMTPLELKNLGGQQHPVLGNYGVESAKSTAVNLMMVLTTWSFLLWQLTHSDAHRTMSWPVKDSPHNICCSCYQYSLAWCLWLLHPRQWASGTVCPHGYDNAEPDSCRSHHCHQTSEGHKTESRLGLSPNSGLLCPPVHCISCDLDYGPWRVPSFCPATLLACKRHHARRIPVGLHPYHRICDERDIS